nr:DUF5872 domain-containing protein [uncultured Rhodopila sp.]
MGSTARRSDPALWEQIKRTITAGDKGGAPGQWSARKAQLAVQEYKRRGGGYAGQKRADNHLRQWTEEDWATKSGERSRDSGERYLPREARAHLSDEDYRRSSAKKREDTAHGRQFSRQPGDIARKTAPYRQHDSSKAELMQQARRRNVPGRSRMDKDALRRALDT